MLIAHPVAQRIKTAMCKVLFGAWIAIASLTTACSGLSTPPCPTCGTVADIVERPVDGKASGAGAIAGAVIGGVVGNQVGGGSGRDAATAAGVIGGGIAGHEAEKRLNRSTVYDIRIELASGGTRTITVPAPMGLAPGDRVRIDGRRILRGWNPEDA